MASANFVLPPKANLSTFLTALVHEVIRFNLVRRENDFYQFTSLNVEQLNQACGAMKITGGYAFLDKDEGTTGMICLQDSKWRHKWSFWVEGGEVRLRREGRE